MKAQKKILQDRMNLFSILRGDPNILATQLEWQMKFLEIEEEKG